MSSTIQLNAIITFINNLHAPSLIIFICLTGHNNYVILYYYTHCFFFLSSNVHFLLPLTIQTLPSNLFKHSTCTSFTCTCSPYPFTLQGGLLSPKWTFSFIHICFLCKLSLFRDWLFFTLLILLPVIFRCILVPLQVSRLFEFAFKYTYIRVLKTFEIYELSVNFLLFGSPFTNYLHYYKIQDKRKKPM